MPTDGTGRSPGRSSLTIRLTLAFGGVALVSVLMVAGLALLLGWQRINVMFDERQAGFPGTSGHPLNDLRSAMVTTVTAAAGLAVLVAVIVAWVLSRRLTVPLSQLIEAAESMKRGARDVRVGPVLGTPREMRNLGKTLDALADSLGHQEQLRRDFVADVAHELRTPVAVLQVNLEALLDGIVAQTPEQIESLHEEVLRLARRVEDLQSLAHADAAALSLHVRPCDLAKITGSAVDQLSHQVKTNNLDISCTLTPTAIEGDPVRLHQVITNVLVNACKYTPAGGHIHISVAQTAQHARLLVRDTGCGIAAEDLPRVFDRFWRSNATPDIPGNGIGMAIVAQLVAAHGGNVDIQSTLGVGTQVTIRLPLPARPGWD
jgi:two-component system sensor histidine kinase BaeS